MSYSSDDSVKERIREATDIVELVSQYVPLRRAGRNYVGRCPWHDDKKPSFTVNPDRQTFKCWPCDIGGDVFAFVMKIENVEFKEALEILADRAGIALPKKTKRIFLSPTGTSDGNDAGDEKPRGREITRKRLFDAAGWLARAYHNALLELEEAAPARKYLAERNLSASDLEKFQIGYAPMQRNWLADKVKNKPEALQILERIGNLKTERRNEDFFRGRLMFPIRDEQGRTVAFGGRLIPDSPLAADAWHKERKYLNTSETALFSKNKILYGLDLAKTRMKTTRRAIVVEGYTDCITAHQFGFGDTVAVLGTALGPAHIRALQRHADKIVLMLDGDAAGRGKSERDDVLTDFIAQGADMAVLTLPDGMDPAEFLEAHGAEALETLLETETVDAMEHAFRAKTRGIDLKNDIIGSSKALDNLLEIVAHAPTKGTTPNDPIRFRIEKTIQNLAIRFLMPEEQIRRRLRENRRRIEDRRQRPATMEDESVREDDPIDAGEDSELWSNPEFLPDKLERLMLETCLADPTVWYELWEFVPVERCRSPITRRIYEKCNELIEHGRPATFDRLMIAFDDPKTKSFLVDLDESFRKKRSVHAPSVVDDGHGDAVAPLLGDVYRDEANELEQSRQEEADDDLSLTPEQRAKYLREILDGFERRDLERNRMDDVRQIRDGSLTEKEESDKLLQMLEEQRRRQAEKNKRFGIEK